MSAHSYLMCIILPKRLCGFFSSSLKIKSAVLSSKFGKIGGEVYNILCEITSLTFSTVSLLPNGVFPDKSSYNSIPTAHQSTGVPAPHSPKITSVNNIHFGTTHTFQIKKQNKYPVAYIPLSRKMLMLHRNYLRLSILCIIQNP